ncbi:MAG: ThiF family adenylyltransferase [Bdellovibrionales bacterium]|nr:ThiF family adenylyltransferase [Bdellovibrionales bacterium]
MNSAFDYSLAFTRNLGILTAEEQLKIGKAHISIAGMGGVGGEYLISLVRMGFQNFRICDIDEFEIQNFNRQFGANIHSLQHLKTKTMYEMALQINPNCRIEIFSEPIQESNADQFLIGTDLVVDGIDFFQMNAHKVLIHRAQSRGIATLAAVPLGFGAGIINFHSNSPSFSDFFALSKARSPAEEVLLFALGFGIGSYHLKYIDPNFINLKKGQGPSIISGIKASVGLITTSCLQVLLWPHEARFAPWVSHYDFRLQKMVSKRLLFGNKGPLQSFKFVIAKKRISE